MTVYVGNNQRRTRVEVDQDATLREVFEFAGIDHITGTNFLNGITLHQDDLEKTLREQHTERGSYLLNTTRSDAPEERAASYHDLLPILMSLSALAAAIIALCDKVF